MEDSHCPKVKLQVPPLRYAPVGMTKFRVVTFIRGREIGWTEMTNWRAAAHLGMRREGWTESINQALDTYPDCPLTLSIDTNEKPSSTSSGQALRD